MGNAEAEHCYKCGRVATYERGLPRCAVHGVLWLLRRNAPSASALIVQDDQILLSRRARDPWKGCWETPGGYIDRGEHPAEAARREVREELGLDVTEVRLLDVLVHEWTPGEWVQNTAYVVKPVDGYVIEADTAEVVEWAWFSLTHLPSPMAPGQAERITAWNRSASET